MKAESAVIKVSSDYNRFYYDQHNRPLDTTKAKFKKLKASIKEYGWLDGFPMMVKQDGQKLVILDGQHRFESARQLGIPVKYVIEKNIDPRIIAKINEPQSAWTVDDYISSYISYGNEHYKYIKEMQHLTGFPIIMVAGMLHGEIASSGNAASKVKSGSFVVKDYTHILEVDSCCSALENGGCAFSRLRSIISTISRLLRSEVVSKEKLENACLKYGSMITRTSKEDIILLELEKILNYHTPSKKPYAFLCNAAMKKRAEEFMHSKKK